jgi:hypothetical protein
MVLAMIRAQVVLPTPRGPQNKKACANVLLRMAFFKVVVIDCCPTTVSKVTGLYFLADTMKLSMNSSYKNESTKIDFFLLPFDDNPFFFFMFAQ